MTAAGWQILGVIAAVIAVGVTIYQVWGQNKRDQAAAVQRQIDAARESVRQQLMAEIKDLRERLQITRDEAQRALDRKEALIVALQTRITALEDKLYGGKA